MLVTFFVLSIEIALVIWQWRRSSFYPYPTGVMLYIIGGQIALAASSVGLAEYPFIKVFSHYRFETDLGLFVLLLFAYFMLVLVSAISQPIRRIDLHAMRRKLGQTQLSGWIVNFAVGAVFAHMVIFWLVLDPADVWANKRYLLMGNEDVLRSPNIFARLILQLWSLVAMMSGMLFGFTLCQRSATTKIICGITFVWYLAYALGAHSRVSFLMLVSCAAVIYIRGQRRGLVAFFLTLGILALPFVLRGRNELDHGLSVLATFPVDAVAALFDSSGATLLNPFEGMFSFAELLDYNAQFPIAFQVLSLLPSISAFDGFDEIRDVYEVPLHLYAPASSFLELSKFHPALIAYYFFVSLIVGRLSVRLLSRDRSPAALLANFFVFVITYLQFTYPVRTVFRLEYVALVLLAFEAFRQRRVTLRDAEAKFLASMSDLRSRRKWNADGPEPMIVAACRLQREEQERRNEKLPRARRRISTTTLIPRAFR